MRHPKPNKRIRPLDNKWTFGNPNHETGYMDICGQRVHRIVAYAFLGEPPTKEYVVDHIDTNRRNNRPENLRWLTRLENVLNNPITRARIENICGSIEAFLNNPSLLTGHEKVDSNFAWMRSVTKEEAQTCRIRLTEWAKQPTKPSGRSLGEWVYQDKGTIHNVPHQDLLTDIQETPQPHERKPLETQSLTPNAIQLDWKNPCEFPCCPQKPSNKPLEEYMKNMAVGEVFSRNHLGESKIIDFGMSDSDNLWVMCEIQLGWKTHAITKITYNNKIYYHENMGVYDIGDEPEELFASIIKR